MAESRSFWLVKSEPDCFSIHDLAKSPKQTTCWSGVRNYQARNFMRSMKLGDRLLFYHSSADPPVVAGTAVVAREAYPDHTALDERDDHYDPKASADNPIWEMVDIRLEEIFPQPLPIGTLRGVPGLKDMELLRKGSRLSVQPVRPKEFELVLQFAKQAAHETAPADKKAAGESAKVQRKPPADQGKPAKPKAAPAKSSRRKTVSRASSR